MGKYESYHEASGISAVPVYSADMSAAPLADLTDSQEKVGVYEGGSDPATAGQKQPDIPGGHGTPDAAQARNMAQEVGVDSGIGTKRPPGIGNAGGGPGPGAKGSGVAIAQGKVMGSGMVNVGAKGEGKSAVDATSPELRSSKAANNVSNGNKELSVDSSQLLGGGMVD